MSASLDYFEWIVWAIIQDVLILWKWPFNLKRHYWGIWASTQRNRIPRKRWIQYAGRDFCEHICTFFAEISPRAIEIMFISTSNVSDFYMYFSVRVKHIFFKFWIALGRYAECVLMKAKLEGNRSSNIHLYSQR